MGAALVDILINTGRLLGHLRGAWRCSCEIACIVNATIEMYPDLEEDLGL